MWLAVLGARSREGPDTADKVDLRPGHARHLLTALPRQSEYLDNCAVTPAHCSRREENTGQLLVGEDPVTGFCDRRCPNALAR